MAMDCEHCDESFGSERARIEHALDAHGDALTSHDRDELKRRLKELEDDGRGGGLADDLPLRTVGLAVGALAVLAVAGYGLTTTGMVSFTTSAGTQGDTAATLGAPGSTHDHARFEVVIEGQSVDFSQPMYQVGQTQNRYIHFEGGDGTQIHKHATGVTIAYALDAHGFAINQSCLSTPEQSAWSGATFCESGGGDLSVTAGGSTVDPATYVIQDGVPVRVAYSAE